MRAVWLTVTLYFPELPGAIDGVQPTSSRRCLLFDMTYAVVVFSLIIQGLTIGKIFNRSQLQQMAEL